MHDEVSPKTIAPTTAVPDTTDTTSASPTTLPRFGCLVVRQRLHCRSEDNYYLGSDGFYHPARPGWRVFWIYSNFCIYDDEDLGTQAPLAVSRYVYRCRSTRSRRLEITAQAQAEAKAKLDVSLYALSNVPEMLRASTGAGKHLRENIGEMESHGRQLTGSCKVCRAGLTCTDLSKRGYSCTVLERFYHCDCSGCECAGCEQKNT